MRKESAGTQPSAKKLRDLKVNAASAISALMRRLKHVRSSGPYTRNGMNER
jgi:hypothetical protein